jgi:putative ABC transport system permease protein
VLHEILPVEVATELSIGVAAQALVFGFVLCFSFALLPLLCVRRVPALAAVRAPVDGGVSLWRDPLTWAVLPAVTGSLIWLAGTLSPPDDPNLGLRFCAALAAGVLVLAGVALGIMKAARAIVRPWWPFTFRQGLAGLYRPRNQTRLFLLSVGMGTALVLATLLTQSMLTGYLRGGKIGTKENFFIIDLSNDQRAKAGLVLKEGGAEVVSEAPVVKSSLTKVNGKSAADMSAKKDRRNEDDSGRVPGWVYTQAYRLSWDPKLPLAAAGEIAPVKVTVERNLANSLKLKPGATLTFTSGERAIECIVEGFHEISWDRLLDNFPVLIRERIPAGLTPAWATGAHVNDSAHGARMQREVSQALKGVTVLDVTAFTAVLADILERGRWLVRSMSILTVITGLIIVIAVLLAGRRDRVEESVLLRTLGASRSQIRRILVFEYLLLGLFAALTGALLAVGFAWLLATHVFHLPFDTWYLPLGAAVGLVCALTAILGMLLSRGVAGHPPLAILRGEG